jgi:hypothetical protein
LHLIEQWSARCAQWGWKLREFHGVSGAPEVALTGKVLLAQILNTKCDIVIGYAAFDFTPEQQFLETHLALELFEG